MKLVHVVILAFALLAAGLTLARCAPAPAEEPAPVCVATLPQVEALLIREAMPYTILSEPEAVAAFVAAATSAGVVFQGTVTRVLLAVQGGIPVYGVELDGRCFSERPIPLDFPVKPAKLSGRQPNGMVFA